MSKLRSEPSPVATPDPPADPAREARRAELIKIVRRRCGVRRADWGPPAGERPPDEEPEPIPAEILEKACTPAWSLELPEPRPRVVRDVAFQRADGVWCMFRVGEELPPTVSRAQANRWVEEGSCARQSLRTVRFHINHWQTDDRVYDDLYGKLGIVPESVAWHLCAPMGRNTASWRDWGKEAVRSAVASGRPSSGSTDIGDGRSVPALRSATDADYDRAAELIPDAEYYARHDEPWRGDPNTLPPCAPPARQIILSGGFFGWVPRPRIRYVSFVYIPGREPEHQRAHVPLWVEERQAVAHAAAVRGGSSRSRSSHTSPWSNSAPLTYAPGRPSCTSSITVR
jgi:hypothetical protein